MANINVISSFQVNNAAPADAKYLVENAAGIQAIIDAGNGYAGMQCYNQADDKLYIVYKDGETLKYKELLGSTASDVSDLQDDVEDIQDALEKLNGDSDDTSVSKKIGDAIAELNTAEGGAVSTDGTFVNVTITQEAGIVTGVSIAEDDIASATDLSTLQTRVGADDTSGLSKRIADLEELAGEESVADQIDSAIEGLATAEGGAKGEGTFVDVTVVQENGVITSVTVDEDDIASASALSTLAGVVGNASEEGKDASGIIAQIEALEEAVGEGGAVSEQIKAVTGTPDEDKTLQDEIDDVEADIETLKGDGEGSVAKAISDAIDGLGGSASQEAGADGLALSVTTENGEVTSISGSIAANTYASYAYEAKVTTLIGDDASKSVRTIANEELAKQLVPEGAKESLDTLQEIAAWIQAHPDDASAMNTAIQNLQTQVGAEAQGEEKPASGLVADIRALEEKMGDTDVDAQIESAIDALGGEATSTEGTFVTVKVTTENGEVSAVNVTENDIASANALAKLQAVVGVSELTEGATSLDTRLKAFEEGDNSVASQIETAIGELEATEGEATVGEGKHVAVQVVQEAGVITSVTVAEDDIASATLLGATTDAKTAQTAFGFIAAEADRADIEEKAIRTLIGTVPAKVGETDTASVVAYVDAKVAQANDDNTTLAGRVTDIETSLADNGTIHEMIDANAEAIATLNGGDDEDGSVAKAVKDEADRVDGIIGTLTKDTVVAEIADAKQAGTDAQINTVTFNEGTALAGTFADNTLTLTDVASASALTKLQAVVGDSELGEGETSVVARLAVIEGDGTGSVAKAQADAIASANSHTDTLVGTIPAKVGETDTTTVVAFVNAKVAEASADAGEVASNLAQEIEDRGTSEAAIIEKFGAEYDKDNTVASAIADAKKAGTDASAEVTALAEGAVADNASDIGDIKTFIGYDGGVNVATQIANAVASAGHLKRTVVDALPTQDIDVDTIYMVLNASVTGVNGSATTNNAYVEYMYINNVWEIIGTTDVDLSDYQKSADLVAMTDDEIVAIFNNEEKQ